jgi:hypothetical protein
MPLTLFGRASFDPRTFIWANLVDTH